MSDATQRQLRANRLQLVGKIVTDGIADKRTNAVAASKAWGISRSSIQRIKAGEDVNPLLWAAVEEGLGLPRALLRMTAEGNTSAIEQMDGMEPWFRTWLLGELGKISKASTATKPAKAPARKRATG